MGGVARAPARKWSGDDLAAESRSLEKSFPLTGVAAGIFFLRFYESRLLHQIRQEAPPGLPGRAPQGQDLRHQQSRAALQGASGLINPFTTVKAEGHPKLNNVCFLDVATGKRFLTRSTLKSARTETIDGAEYFLV